VTKQYNEDCKRLLRLMGVPVIEDALCPIELLCDGSWEEVAQDMAYKAFISSIGVNLAFALEFRKALSKLPNIELLLAHVFASRYWTPTIKKLLGELLHAESEKEFMLKSILQRLIGHLCEHHSKWRQLVSATA
ncbi:DNA mismatch repair protein MSH6 isoform X2, partial [Fagus crenata]